MTRMMSPEPTDAPSATFDLGDGAVLVGDDVVLHLHRLEDADDLTLGDGVAHCDLELEDGALHRRGDLAGARRDGGALGARPLAGLGKRAACGRRTDLVGRDEHLDGEPLAVDLDVDAALDLLDVVVVAAAGAGDTADTGEIETVLDPLGGVLALGEVVVFEDLDVGRDGGGRTLDDHLVEGAEHAGDGLVPVRRPDTELAHEVVVVLADLVAALVTAVPPDTDALGRGELGDRAGGGEELAFGRVFGVDPDLDGVPAKLDLVLGEAELLACGDAELLGDEVDARDQFGHGVLDLEPGVHLEEEELAVLVEELDGAGVDVVARLGDLDRRLAHGLADLVGEVEGRGLLDQLLVAALRRAVALADPDAVAVRVGDDLHLDVAGPREVALDVALVASEALECLGLGRLERAVGLVGRLDDAHASAAAAVGRLDGDGPAVLLAEGDDIVAGLQVLGGAGHALHAGFLRRDATRDLLAHDDHGLGRRADEDHAAVGDLAGEVRVLGEEAVTGVDGFGAGALDDVEDRLGVEVGLRGGRAAEGIGLVSQSDVQRVTIQI